MKTLNLNEMEQVNGGNMPCGVALGLYGIAFVSAAAATGGWAVPALISMGGSIWGVIDAC